MIRLFHVYFPERTILLAATEALLIIAALFLVSVPGIATPAPAATLYIRDILRILIASSVVMLCMHYYDLYDTSLLHNPSAVLPRIIQVLGTACLLLAVLYYVYPVAQLSRGPFVIWILLIGIFLGGWRQLFALVNRSPRLRQPVLLLGQGAVAQSLASEIGSRPHLGLELVGYVGESSATAESLSSLRCLGKMESLRELVENWRIGRIILTMSEQRGRLPVDELLKLKSKGIAVQDGADVFEAVTGRVMLESLRPSWLLFSDGFGVSSLTLLYKRLASIVISSAGLTLTLPFMVLAAIAIRLDSRGPVIFRQQRIGKGGKPFTLYKFRSMSVNADADGVVRPARKQDARITRVGRWLRKLRIDELPQLYNILRGDMYCIGPRPFTPNLERDLEQQIPFYGQRWSVKPGATGWAQVRRGYNETLEDNREKLSYDLFYIKNLSFGLDCLILFETIKILILGRGGR